MAFAGLKGDIRRSLQEGKSLVVEGAFLSPRLLRQLLWRECAAEMRLAVVVMVLLSATQDQHLLMAQAALAEPARRCGADAHVGFAQMRAVQELLLAEVGSAQDPMAEAGEAAAPLCAFSAAEAATDAMSLSAATAAALPVDMLSTSLGALSAVVDRAHENVLRQVQARVQAATLPG